MKDWVLLILTFIFVSLLITSTDTQAQNRSIGPVIDVMGEVLIRYEGSQTAKTGYILQATDTLETGSDGYISFNFQDHSQIHLMSNSRLIFHQIHQLNHTEQRIKLLKGEMQIKIDNAPLPVQITTPTAIASTTQARFNVRVFENNSTTFTGIQGNIEITAAASGDTQMLSRRNKLSTDVTGQYFIIQQASNREMDTILNIIEIPRRTPRPSQRN